MAARNRDGGRTALQMLRKSAAEGNLGFLQARVRERAPAQSRSGGVFRYSLSSRNRFRRKEMTAFTRGM